LRPIKLGIVGLGQFSPEFIRLFQAHPGVSDVYICDVVEERIARVSREFGISETFNDFDELLASDVDAVAIFTQRWLHGPMTIAALKKGKHVYSAVPMGVSVEEIEEILSLVRSTGLTYMTGETSYYYPSVVFCRNEWQKGSFGQFVYGEGEYLHDMSHGFYKAYQYSGGEKWQTTASFPPMFYPTHSLGCVLGVTNSYATTVSCVGYVDREQDGVFDKEVSLWGNDFSNEVALFTTADGGSVRIGEMRRIGVPNYIPEVRLSLFGTQASFEQQTASVVWQTLDGYEFITDRLDTKGVSNLDQRSWEPSSEVAEDLRGSFRTGFASVHDTSALPEEFAGLPNGHEGSHQYLVHDFVEACVTGTMPHLNAWVAARYSVPGLIAHQSALQGGARLSIPDFGLA
jgi:predicted dehydrogenase